jgi:hypothetical protein
MSLIPLAPFGDVMRSIRTEELTAWQKFTNLELQGKDRFGEPPKPARVWDSLMTWVTL